MAGDDRRNEKGKTGTWLFNPLNAAAAAWGAAVGIGCAVLGIRRSGRRKEMEKAAGPLPERPEAPSARTQVRSSPSVQERQDKVAEPKPAPSAKVASISEAAGRRSATGPETKRREARPAPPAKQGTAAKSPGLSDKGGSQPPGQRNASAGTRPAVGSQPRPKASNQPSAQQHPQEAKREEPRAGAPAAARPSQPRPKASDKHPAQPRPGKPAREEAPAPSGPQAVRSAQAGPQRPPALDSPRGGKADDLKQIAGIGPKLEQKLNQLGIYHYEQIAGWTDSGVAWIDAELQAKGRVQRDNWIGQAAALKAGVKQAGGNGSVT